MAHKLNLCLRMNRRGGHFKIIYQIHHLKIIKFRLIIEIFNFIIYAQVGRLTMKKVLVSIKIEIAKKRA